MDRSSICTTVDQKQREHIETKRNRVTEIISEADLPFRYISTNTKNVS